MASSYTGYSSLVIKFIRRPPVRLRKSRTSWWVLAASRLPGMTLTTRRCSGSKATWSQWSPCRWSSGSSGLQRFCFLPTKAHFSSNWTSRVRGGKGHQLVVELAGLRASQEAVANDGILVHADEPTGLADAAAFGDVVQDTDDLAVRQSGVEQGRALAFGEAGLAGAASQHAALLRAVAEAHPEVAQTPFPLVGAVAVLTAEARQGVGHGGHSGRFGLNYPLRKA